MTPHRGSAAVILNDAGHVLLVKHTYGRLNWELPGGGAEPNESMMATAVREVGSHAAVVIPCFARCSAL
jgi:8-oxo-dGTP diphosphatase